MTAASRVFSVAKIGEHAVPPMAIGTWSWGDTQTWGHQDEHLDKIKESWAVCNDAGLTFYDTAEIYGQGESERIIGRLMKETDPEIRKKLFIATKIVRNLKRSLERLGVDSVDLYQLHSASGPHSFASYAKGFAECYKQGLCKNVGVSNFGREELIKFSDLLSQHGVPLASNQVEFSLLRKLPETTGLLEECKNRNIALLAYSPLGMGRLTGKYSASNPPPKGRKFGGAYTWDQLDPLIESLKSIAERHSVTPSAVALNWVMCKGAIPLGGARNGEQARQNALALTFRLSAEEVAELDGKGFEGTTSVCALLTSAILCRGDVDVGDMMAALRGSWLI